MVVACGVRQPVQEIKHGIVGQILAMLVGVRAGVLGPGIESIGNTFTELQKMW